MVCKNCGMANSDMAKVCSECGSVLPKPAPKVQPASGEASAQTQQPAAAPVQIVSGAAVQGIPVMQYIPMQYGYMPTVAPVQVPSYPPYGAFTAPAHSTPYAAMPMQTSQQVAQAQPAVSAAAPQPTPAAPQVPPQMPTAANVQEEIPVNPHPFGEPMPTAGSYAAQPVMPPQTPPQMPAYFGQVPPYQPPYGMPLKDPNGTKAVWALALGIASLVLPLLTCFFASPIGVVAGIIALILGGICMNKVFPQNRAKAIAGLVMGICGTLLSLLGITVLYNSLSGLTNSEEFKYFYDQYNSAVQSIVLTGMRIAMQTVKVVIGRLQQVLGLLFLR
ncbi:MAG: hypothetical protein IKE65_09930 [Clostridia bacterium]|nr:hypothetical protein [Clostridia bacterium]